MPRSSPEPIDLPDELPELDDDAEAADDSLREDPDAVAIPLGDELDTDRDDEMASDLDIGIDLSVALDAGADASDELVLDIGELLDDARERGHEEDAGNEPPEADELDTGVAIQPLPDTPDGDEDEAPPDSGEVDAELPALDADEPGDFGAEPKWLEIDSLAASDQPLRDAGQRWHSRTVDAIEPPCHDLTPAHGDVLVAGAGLWRARSDGAELLFTDDLALDGIAVAMGSVVYRSSSGSLRRVVLDAGTSSATAAAVLDDTVSLQVATVHDGERVIAIGGSRSAYESADGGQSWAPISVAGRVLAVPRRSDRLWLLTEERGERKLLVEETRGSFAARPLDPTSLLVVGGDAPQIAALEQVVVLLQPGRGLVVSADGGGSFAAVPGCAGAVAICLGRFQGRIYGWTALQSEWTGKTDIALIDPAQATAERVAELSVGDGSEESEPFPTSALCWDGESGRLWVGGAQGLVLLEPDEGDELPNLPAA